MSDARVAYLTWGDANQPPVLMLHALTGRGLLWEPVAQRLADAGFYVVAVDLRGHGESDRGTDYEIPFLAADVMATIEHLGLAPVHLVGHSVGATVAWTIAAAGPEMIRRLVIEDQHPNEDPEAGARWRAWAASWPWSLPSREGARRYLRANDRSLDWWEPSLVPADAGQWGWAFDRTAIEAIADNVHAYPAWETLVQVEAPVLVIRGGRSTHLSAPVAERMIDAFQRGRLVTLTDADHWCHRMADPYADAVLHFLRDGAVAPDPA